MKTAVCVAFRGQGDAAARQIVSLHDYYGYTVANWAWPQHSGTFNVAGFFFETNLQLNQAVDVFVYTSDRSRLMYYTYHLDPNLPI